MAILSAAAAALLVAGCGRADPANVRLGDPGGPGGWQAVPAGPLSPREAAVGLWTGEEVLLIGGSDAPPCPPGASCVPPDAPPLADGAAFDPLTGEWRRIADAPAPLEWAQGFVVGGTAYLWIPGSRGRPEADPGFLAYRIEEDRWERLPLPPGDLDLYSGIVRAGEGVVAYAYSDEEGEQADAVFDRATKTWTELPPDPLSPSFDRSLAWSGRELVLFDHELVPNPGSARPAVTRAAALDLETGAWRRLPDSEILATGPWVLDAERLINPGLGGEDGGETGNWGRAYRYGGILDPATGEWSALPDPPDGEEDFGSGVLTDSGGHYFAYRGWILDTTAGTWIEIPTLDRDELVTGRTVVSTGDDLLVFGGARWNGLEATLLADAWTWSPRASSSGSSLSHSSAPFSSRSSQRSATVPDVVGLSEGEAVKALAVAGLVADVRYADDAPRTGKVLRSDPSPGSQLAANAVVVVSVAYGPRLPMPTPEQEQLPEELGSLIEDNWETFFGTYRDEAGVLVVVFNPGVDPATWEERLTAAAEGLDYPAEDSGYRTDTCPRTRKTLRALQDEIVRTRKEWAEDKRLAFGVWVQPETCTVRVESDLLTHSDIETLVARHGTAISFDTSAGVARALPLPLPD